MPKIIVPAQPYGDDEKFQRMPDLGDSELAEVTKKFYTTESQRKKLQKQNRGQIVDLYKALGALIQDLYLKEVRFFIFHVALEAKPPTIHVGLTVCCEAKRAGKREQLVTPDLRRYMEHMIKTTSRYKKVVWEM